jgi:uncharacterized protein (UPF0548 family)
MSIRLRRPQETHLAELLANCGDGLLTYSPVGGSLDGAVPNGLRRHQWSVALPKGSFDAAVAAIEGWAVHRGAGLSVLADGPIRVGANVAMSAPLPVGFVDVTCRIVAVVDESERQGFAYGTLAVHPESGEEAFIVVRDEQGVRFEVQAVSAPRHPLARLVPPLADRLQDAAVKRYLSAMTKIVET